MLFLFLIGDGLWWWYARSRFPSATKEHRRRRQFVAFIAITAISSVLWIASSRLFHANLDAYTPRILTISTLIWHLVALPVALLVMISHTTATLTSKLRRIVSKSPVASSGETRLANARVISGLSRRDFLTNVGAFAPIMVTGLGSAYSLCELSSLRVRHLDVPISGLPSELDGLSIAHVSDTHLGRFTTADMFRKIVTAVNGLDADLVIHTGDLINDDQRLLPMAAQLAREMKSKYGLFIVEGNHDLIGGREPFESFMRKERMPLLVNDISGVTINGRRIEFLGLPWTRGGRTNGTDATIADGVEQLARRRSNGALPILLAHHPHAFDAAAENGIPLTLGGHTHGGQMNLTAHLGIGPLMYRYWSGLYSRDGCHTIISNGAGNWFPLRINAPAEIARIVLRRA